MDIFLTNTRTRAKELFSPIDPMNVRIYVCGPTVYDRAHMGNARAAIVFDVLVRLMRHVYGPDHVTYVRNFTDVDDKINARAAQTGEPISAITARTAQWYLDDMAAVGVLEPDHMPRATQYIPQMIAMIEGLIDSGHAYAADEHVLFSVSSYERYGALSGRSVDDMIAGARVEVAPYKRDPMDFVLWKPSSEDLPGWESPWGRGRPGWHIECSAMAEDLLWRRPLEQGRLSDEARRHPHVFDIHGGGNDLAFPHHENEIAQSCCANHSEVMANVWLHNEMLQVEGKKMSKSLGNFFTVRDLLDQGIPGEVIRFVMLSTHYRKPMDWTAEKVREAQETLSNWRALLTGVAPTSPSDDLLRDLGNDLNTSKAIYWLRRMADNLRQYQFWEEHNVKDLVRSAAQIEGEFVASAQLLGLLDPDLGQWYDEAENVDLTVYSESMVALRAEAMQTKDFSKVDRLKKALVAAGVEVRMSKAGVELVPGPGFDAAKLEGL
ncbi:cysteine--tRNA ligase [Salipiger sp. 1_MG-2023]|uniref:cysteine--tRNA ligase n=1 Tax=Salipiger sp. 1_MG-2023 TaxID=3062665 RepID=UPI0026E34AB9|nr:cysteine--tRNA ligase [Salipiger sp. 1_MG-2023]MDO6587069.1 cysteine--tRNA ligase [Salipiger sp. 1_MG-2023]